MKQATKKERGFGPKFSKCLRRWSGKEGTGWRRLREGVGALKGIFSLCWKGGSQERVVVDPQFCPPSTCPIRYLFDTLQ